MKTKLALCIIALAGCFLCGNIFAQANLGNATISNVTGANGACVASTTNPGPHGDVQFWDIQAGGTYTVTLTGATDCYLGANTNIGVVVHSSVGGNIYKVATWQSDGVYTFTINSTDWTGQCQTMPIEYCTHDSNGNPANAPGTGKFALDVPGAKKGHLRTATFDTGCTNPVPDITCGGSGGGASITACKFYDKNANGVQDGTPLEPALAGWPFCLSDDNGPVGQTQSTGTNGECVTWSNLTTPNDYVVTEANANESNWFHSTPDTSLIVFGAEGGSETRTFGNYCTSPSGGLTLGFWSNKNGNKVLTGVTAGNGVNLLPAVTNLLNSPCTSAKFVNANGSIHTFTGTFADLKNWLLGATATNMAYMLSAQEATLLLDTHYGSTIGSLPAVDGNAFDLCSHLTVNGLISAACDTLTGPGNQLTLSGNPSRPGQEMLKNCIDKINNNGDVIPVTPCPYTFTSGNPCP
jgi:hypothetical protein